MDELFDFFIDSLAKYKKKFSKYICKFKKAQNDKNYNQMALYSEKIRRKSFVNMIEKIRDISPEFNNNVYNTYIYFDSMLNSQINGHSIEFYDEIQKLNKIDDDQINITHLKIIKINCNKFKKSAKEEIIKIFEKDKIFYNLLKNSICNLSEKNKQILKSSLEQFNNEKY